MHYSPFSPTAAKLNNLLGLLHAAAPRELSELSFHRPSRWRKPVLGIVTTAAHEVVEAEAAKLGLALKAVAGGVDYCASRFIPL